MLGISGFGSATLLIEQSFSDFGDLDLLILLEGYDLKLDRGNCDLDRRHILNLNYV